MESVRYAYSLLAVRILRLGIGYGRLPKQRSRFA